MESNTLNNTGGLDEDRECNAPDGVEKTRPVPASEPRREPIVLLHTPQGWVNAVGQQVEPPPAPYGLLDTKDNVWLGHDGGPQVYEDYGLARIAARVPEKRLGYDPGRVQAKSYDPAPKKLRDEVTPKITAEEALKRLEAGEL